jgi:RHS repeat-associated protein
LVSGGTTIGATYDDQDRILTYGNYIFTYNARGELSGRTESGSVEAFTYVYNSLGALTQMTHTWDDSGTTVTDTFAYKSDAFGRRIEISKNGTVQKRYIYDENNRLVAELNSSGNLIAHYVYANQVNVPDYVIQGGVKYKFIHDHLGSVVRVIDTATGNIISSIDYDEFGRITSSTSLSFQPFGFAGGIRDDVSGFIRFGVRDYDPEIGRWISKDPILFGGNDTNLYGYVMQDPVNFIDPMGLRWEYNSNTGQLIHFDNQTSVRTLAGNGYSGTGPGRNNQSMSPVSNVGPIPVGSYTMGPAVNSPQTGPNVIPLTPNPGTNTFGRTGFQIHGNNSSDDASRGCIVMPPGVRNQIINSGDNDLVVK